MAAAHRFLLIVSIIYSINITQSQSYYFNSVYNPNSTWAAGKSIVSNENGYMCCALSGDTYNFYQICIVNLDSRSVQVNSSLEFFIRRENFKINLIQLDDESYFRTIREKLLWGLDIRN